VKPKKKQDLFYDKVSFKLHKYGCTLKLKKFYLLGEFVLNFLYIINIFLLKKDFKSTSRAFCTNRYKSGLAELYEPMFNKIRNKRSGNILEIGIGGHNTITGGGGLRALKKIFKHKIIYGLDIMDKCHLSAREIIIIRGSQIDNKTLQKFKNIKFDLIIDDGSHYPSHQLATFKKLYKNIAPGGLYIIEDLDLSFHKKFKLNIIDYTLKNQKFLFTNKSSLSKLYFASTSPSQKAIIFEKRDYNFSTKVNLKNKTKQGFIKKINTKIF
tara:strand:- start:652 stop:1455 length:804 start_codon:yes stop_codon:yes gene_type:complete